jgi:hypothetical protein
MMIGCLFIFAFVYTARCCSDGQGVCLQKTLDRFALEQKSERKELVFWCTYWCGGIGDRIAGLTTVFYMALVLRRKFSIWMPKPVQMNTLFEPNKYNWKNLQEPHCDYRLNAVDRRALLRLNDINGTLDIFATKTTVCISVNHMGISTLVQTNPDLFGTQPPSFHYAPYFGEAFRFLFLPSARLNVAVEQLRSNAQLPPFSCFACPSTSPPWYAIHFRTGNGTNWVDPIRDKMSATMNIVDCFKKSKSALNWPTAKHTVYVASDNHFAKKNLAYAIDNATFAQLPIAHTDRSNANMNGHYEAWAEFVLLMHATCLVTSRSGFSQYAAFGGASTKDTVPRCLIGHLQCETDLGKLLKFT